MLGEISSGRWGDGAWERRYVGRNYGNLSMGSLIGQSAAGPGMDPNVGKQLLRCSLPFSFA